MNKAKFTSAIPIGVAFLLAGCGTVVPNLQESGGAGQAVVLVHAIVDGIHCELRHAIYTVDKNDADLAASLNQGVSHVGYLKDWAVQVTLSLQVEEKTAVSPSALWTPNGALSSIFSIGASATGSADATRIDKLNYFYTLKELRASGDCQHSAIPPEQPGSLLIQSDLKITEWLTSHVLLVGTNEVIPRRAAPSGSAGKSATGASDALKSGGTGAPNGFSHEVIFQVVSSGTVTPAWKLIKASFNQSATPFSTSRDRKHDLLLTFGPQDPKLAQTLAPTAQSLHSSALINQNLMRGATP
jgi:hypothetical protein